MQGQEGRSQPAKRTITTQSGRSGSTIEGARTTGPGGLPHYRVAKADQFPDGILAVWQPNDPDYPEGVVLINSDHSVLRAVIEHWPLQYADHHAEDIERDVLTVYGQVAVSKIAHSEHLKGILPAKVVETALRSDEALTMAMLGLMAEDHLISTRIGGKYSKKRLAVVDKRPQKNSELRK